MTIYAAAGAKLFIGGEFTVDGDVVTTDFDGETWTEVKQLEGLGSLGDASEEVTFDDLGKRRRQRIKGVRNAEPMEIVAGLDHADPGQSAIFAAERSDANFAFRVVFDDAPTGGTPSERMFAAQVGSAREELAEANSVIKLMASLWINTNVARVQAAAGV